MVASIIQTLAAYDIPLSDTLIADAYTWWSESSEDPSRDLLDDEMGQRMAEAVTGVEITIQA